MSSKESAAILSVFSPIDGAIVHRRLGRSVDGGLEIAVEGSLAPGYRVLVDGVPAPVSEGRFSAPVLLRQALSEIVVAAEGPGPRQQQRIRVLWDRHSQPRYRFSIDDNSYFLRDIAQRQYASLFDCFYLATLRDLHRQFGTKFALNIYYTTGDDFDLSRFPDRYRGQWRDNADWLRLAFHARADKPDRPYQDAPVEQLLADFDQVAEQVHRFAPDAYSPPTVIHWAMIRPEAYRPLYERGVRVLSGFFQPRGQGWDTVEAQPAGVPDAAWDINYRLDDARSAWLWRHDALKDFASGLLFSSADVVCNTVPLDEIVPVVREAADDPCRGEILDLFTHEQYFWPFFERYLPDHAQRLEAALRFVTERGYQPVFLHEGFLGGPE